MLFPSFLLFITTPTRTTRNTKTLIDNIFYNKPLNDIMSGNLSSIISDHLLEFLIEPSKFTKKSLQMAGFPTGVENMGGGGSSKFDGAGGGLSQ